MTIEVGAMIGAGVAALVAGLVLVRGRFRAASSEGKIIVLGPVFAATALAVFSSEHFTVTRELSAIVPRWLPDPMFWTYLVGTAWLAAAISFIAWREVRWSASLVAVLMLTIVATIDLPGLPKGAHSRIFWVLTVRETCFAGGAMVLAGSVWSRGRVLMPIGRVIVGCVFVFYAIEHFLFPHNVPGVPLEKMTPAWVPGAVVIAYVVGAVLLVAGVCLLIRRRVRMAAAGSGTVLVLLTVFFYVPILVAEFHSPLADVFDTLLFAATALLAGFGAEAQPAS
ncbi:MAG TPA: hypothetical protein VFW25_02820 [Silvibacterium sp.]|nr:hypothetical protein [Silvibacterium sp.]